MATILISDAILKPYSSSSSPSPSSGVDEQSVNVCVYGSVIPLTVFDIVTHDCHIGILFVFKPPIPSNQVLKDALSKVLVHYPHLTGSLTDNMVRTSIILNNAGVSRTETYTPTTLAAQVPFDTSKYNRHLLPSVKGVGEEMVRGFDIQLFPCHDRLYVSQPRSPPKVEFDHGSIEFRKTNLDTATPVSSSSVETVIINYSAEFMNRLKVMVSNNAHQSYCTFECLLSHVWKKVTQVRISVNGRPRISEPAVNMEYFEGGNGKGTDYLQQTTPEFGSTLCPDLEVDSWLRFRFHDIDFGGGSPCRVIPPKSPFEGLVVFIPAGAEDGGVDVKLTLFAEHVRLFEKIAHSIDSNIYYPAKIGI
ncbi:hypothetical protein MKX03_035685 [Papaver bracteatum]|nr:hypothetical protein MKX03_035685 [Papaver bracteatum]